jgi:phosphoribosylamine---glycine ligase
MRILIIDPQGAALDFAIRSQQCGHKVKHFIRQNDKTRFIGRGFVDLVSDYRPWLRWADIIFNSDNTLYLRDLDMARREGALVISASQESAQWELDRDLGMKIMKKHGIQVPANRTFTDYDTAIAYVKRENRRFVSKPSGDADKALSYVAKTPADLVYMLERWKKQKKMKAPFILQEFVGGTEMAVGGWFGPGGFNVGWCENFEFKKLMDGDKGVATGEQGTVIRYVRNSKLAKKVLMPLAGELEKVGYVGYVDVNCIIDDKGTPWPLEFTMRPGWPTFNIQQALHEGDCAEWLKDLAEGRDARNLILDKIAIGVVLSVPDYPYSHLTKKEVAGTPIYGITDRIAKNLHPCEMMMGEAPTEVDGKIVTVPIPVTAGDYVLCMSAIGDTVLEAKRKAYRRLEALTVPNSPMWRTDIGDRLSKQLPIIQAHGYATGMQFSKQA